VLSGGGRLVSGHGDSCQIRRTGLTSPFLAVPADQWVASNSSAFAIRDAYPVGDGHTLIVPRRLIGNWWEITAEERQDLLALLDEVRDQLEEKLSPDGYNVGFNDGDAAGQTISHFHIHLIPRWRGDMDDPRGGVRHVIPSRGNYLRLQPLVPQAAAEARLVDGIKDRFLHLELTRLFDSRRFDRVDLVVSFIMYSGLRLLDDRIEATLDRGGQVRVLTTDYLNVTDVASLTRLLDLGDDSGGCLETRVFQNPDSGFHPKSYLFYSSVTGDEVGFVGSSNLSRSGINHNIEWNVRLDDISAMRASFDALWNDPRATTLTLEWLAGYRSTSAAIAPRSQPPEIGEDDQEPVPQPVEPRPIQREALAALEQTRAEGFHRALVVMATGLGKTWLAAFDTNRPSFRRVLFLAHREEILRQSRDVFRRVRPDGDMGLFYGQEKQPDADVVFATVQTLSGRLDEFAPDRFDYIVVDEFHHAAAETYRRVIDHFRPDFMLGLTATPERMDGADLLVLSGDNLAFECGLGEGIERGELSPFEYWGIRDVVDYEPIPWRNSRFDPKVLTDAVETHDRAQHALDEWHDKAETATLAFCCSITHADFMAEFFMDHGVAAVAVHSGDTSAPRRAAVEQLQSGAVKVVFTVDVFNEGVDIPEIGAVMMLRPTESPTIFLQQMGRGLRVTESKQSLQVIDFVGNHKSFLMKPRVLLSLGPMGRAPTRIADALERGEMELPPGCSVNFDLELIAMFKEMTAGTTPANESFCIDFTDEMGHRPTALQAHRSGYNPASVSKTHGGWFGFLDSLELLTVGERDVLGRSGVVVKGFETESVTKSYKLVTLTALTRAGRLRTGMGVSELCAASLALVVDDPRLAADIGDKTIDPFSVSTAKWEAFWRKWPLSHLVGDRKLFRFDGDDFVPTFRVDEEAGHAFDAMVAEILEWRLADHLLNRVAIFSGAIRCRLSHSGGNPIVFLNRKQHAGLPMGETVFVANGEQYVGDFVKIALNTAGRPGESGNALHALLRGWFGPSAGHPGTKHTVTLEQVGGLWVMRPVEAAAAGSGRVVPLFPTYEVACGAAEPVEGEPVAGSSISLLAGRVDSSRNFVAFASGDSMSGGADPIREGDPLLFEWVRGVDRTDLIGERLLVARREGRAMSASLKVLGRADGRFELRSTNPAEPTREADSKDRITARLVRRLDQEELNPLAKHIGGRFKRMDVASLHGHEFNPGNWNSGHVSVDDKAVLFVTIEKSSDMSHGSGYSDHFESPSVLVWSSQNSVGPNSKKGREILEATETGTGVHAWVRRKKTDVAFEYCGLVVPLSHEGDRPMHVRFRLLTPLTPEAYGRLGP